MKNYKVTYADGTVHDFPATSVRHVRDRYYFMQPKGDKATGNYTWVYDRYITDISSNN